MNFQLTTSATLPPGGSVPLTFSEEAGLAPGPFWTGYRRKTFIAPASNRTEIPRSSGP